MIVMGGSLGGFEAVTRILEVLAPNPGPPVVIVLHRGATTQYALADNLARNTGCSVHEVVDGQRALPGHVYVAPPDYHLLVDRHHLSLSLDAPQSHARPSIDALFVSAADVFGARVIGVLLTASSEDGVQGLVAIRAAGGIAVVQSPESARSARAPQAAVDRGATDHVAPLDEIGALLRRLMATRPG